MASKLFGKKVNFRVNTTQYWKHWNKWELMHAMGHFSF